MRRTESPSRPAALAATATTLIALVAMAAGSPDVRPEHRHDVRCLLSETVGVRAVAAVVAAAARDLLGPAASAEMLMGPPDLEPPAEIAGNPRPPAAEMPRGRPTLAERLLDLPPPIC